MKKLAIVALTPGGGRLAAKIGCCLPADLFGKRGRCTVDGMVEFDSLADWLREAVYRYDAFVMVMAAGIAVRLFAPHIVHKSVDPAVVVVDEGGGYAISLLSGHLGGANALAREIGAAIGAQPVITTATDVNGRTAADVLAVELGLRIANIGLLKGTNAALVAGENVIFYLDRSLPKVQMYVAALAERAQPFVADDMAAIEAMAAGDEACVVVTSNPSAALLERKLVLMPGRLVAGIGCRRNVSCASIRQALAQSCAAVNMEVCDIIALASTTVKRDEPGLLAAAVELGVPLVFYEHEMIAAAIEKYHLPISSFVEKQIGVGNVCEATALLKSRSKKLILRKTKYPQVTVALAWEK